MPRTKEDISPSDKYDEFREALEHLHHKEIEHPGEEYGMQTLWETAYDNILDDIIHYGNKAGIDFIRIVASRMNDEPKYIREQFIKALGSIGKKKPETAAISMKAMMECLEDPDFGIQVDASRSLAEMAKRSPDKVIPYLVEALKHSDNLVRKRSAETLAEIAKGDPTLVVSSIPHLVHLLDDPDVGAAINAADALEAISKRSLLCLKSFVSEMQPATKHWNANVSDTIKRIIARLGQLEQLPGLNVDESSKKELEDFAGDIEATQEIESDYVFILMAMKEDPFLEDVNAAIKRVCSSLQLRAERVDDILHSGRIIDKIIERIKASRIMIVDLTYERPNV